MVVELEARLLRLALQILEMGVEIGDPVFGVEAHRHGQIGRGAGWLISAFIHGQQQLDKPR